MDVKKFDLVVLGAGVGGYPAAIRASQQGKSVALIEAKEIGGTCLNRGCIPSKALIAGAEFITHLKEAAVFGVELECKKIDYFQLASHKDKVVKKMRTGLENLIAANKITLFRGQGQFISPYELKVMGQDNAILSAKNIVIATGSEPKNISAFPFDYEKIHNSTSLLALTTLPKKLIIIGGGVIGCEFASLYNTLGVEVLILELLPCLIASEAIEVSETVAKAFLAKNIGIKTEVKVEKIEKTNNGVKVYIADGQSFTADCCLVAVGRSLNTKGIGLEKAGIKVEENGMIAVNSKMQTAVDGIYAVGDIASKWWLAHVATHQGIIAAENICGNVAHMSYEAIPSVIFTHPEIGSVGLTLEMAKKQGYQAKLAAFPFQALGKAQATLQTEGFAQLVVEENTGQILGAQIVGYEASTLIAEITLAIANELTIDCLADTIHAHPTFGEIWLETAFIGQGLPIHFPPKNSLYKSKDK